MNAQDKEMKKRLDLIFCSINRNKTNMDFEHFLQTLVKVAEAKFPQIHPSQGLKALVDHHMLPLAARMIHKQDQFNLNASQHLQPGQQLSNDERPQHSQLSSAQGGASALG